MGYYICFIKIKVNMRKLITLLLIMVALATTQATAQQFVQDKYTKIGFASKDGNTLTFNITNLQSCVTSYRVDLPDGTRTEIKDVPAGGFQPVTITNTNGSISVKPTTPKCDPGPGEDPGYNALTLVDIGQFLTLPVKLGRVTQTKLNGNTYKLSVEVLEITGQNTLYLNINRGGKRSKLPIQLNEGTHEAGKFYDFIVTF